MEYTGYKLYFPAGIHIGQGSLEDSAAFFGADTLFSALCIEAYKKSPKELEHLTGIVREGKLIFSDAMPYIGEILYLPKPILHLEGKERGSSVEKKAFKKLEYIPAESFRTYLDGELDAEKENNFFKNNFGISNTRDVASVRGEEETLPYRVGTWQYQDEAGLYLIVGYEDKEDLQYFKDLLDMLSFAGIGGKRSAGLGRFEANPMEPGETIRNLLQAKGGRYMSLSVCLPREEEMEQVLEGASYSLLKRSGFVYSQDYADSQLRKRDLFVFRAGSCFKTSFEGDIYDVSFQGKHPVYRYAKPMFMGVCI